MRRALRRAGGARGPLKDGVQADLPEDDADRLRQQIDACLRGQGGEVSARTRAAELGETYLVLDATGRRRFLDILAREYDTAPDALDEAIAAYREAVDERARATARRRLREVLVAPRVRLLGQFNGLRQGVKFLVDLRAELLSQVGDDPGLRALETDLRALLTSWFDVGFLTLERITWRTPAALLEKLIEYEAVHAFRSWDDLKHRLEGDRRCYAFFHPNMPEEPLIFVQVALVTGMADNVQALLDERAPLGDSEDADSAIFYSISNCQAGLAGVSFGSFLIKRVADDLARQLPNLKRFATLSPVPGFRDWLDERIDAADADLVAESEARSLEAAFETSDLRRALASAAWWEDEARAEALREPLMRACARYLVEARHGARARDRVAHFHLTNGARIERLNWLADTSPKGIEQSASLMVNYLYRLNEVERNHEAYRGDGRVTAAAGVRKLLK
ncbi:MAG: malonyl-CoA decarboxylase [Ectothiorhodospiraceae bacterium]|nr:malonyl-CoA decarboxylase [Chromatiales bacterium]MCP5156707.1 malonyl-CoA decarboxylase [Ectothiorhodospiraceae bacterium]